MSLHLTPRERFFLQLLEPEGATIQIGLTVAAGLCRRGFLHIAKFKRYGITEKGRDALHANEPPPPERRPKPKRPPVTAPPMESLWNQPNGTGPRQGAG